jgi:methyltransferase
MSDELTRLLFAGLVLALACQRLAELAVSRRHERALRERGAVEHARGQMPVMIALHAGWLVAMLAEVFVLERTFEPWLGASALAVLAVGQGLRLWAISALGERWTVRVLTWPGEHAVASGPFRYIRHPNYLGVWLETVALPLVHGGVITAAVFGVAQAAMLAVRIRAEERALRSHSNYAEQLDPLPRFVPRPAGHGPR